MNNKVKFLRGTSNEYTVAEKDNDTIYFTTDDGKLYIGDKEVSGSDITIDDTLSDTSTNPVQGNVIKQAIDNKADKTVATTTADGLMSAADKTKLDGADDTYALKSKYGDTTINVGRKAGTAGGIRSTAEGYNTTASGDYSHAEGASTTASGNRSHAEGYLCTASSGNSHAEGNNTTASGTHSHSEGDNTIASGIGSHAGGASSIASSDYSFAHGMHVESNNSCEVSLGKFNKSSSDTLFSIGDGTSDSARHNAFEITTTGGKLHDKEIATTDIIPDLSAYAKKTDIPTELPANGGNADTVKGVGISDVGKKGLVEISTDYGVIEIGTHIDFHTAEGQDFDGRISKSDKFYFHNSDSSKGTLSANIDGDASSVGGKLPEKIFYDNGISSDLDSATQSGCYAATPDTLNAPYSSWWIVDTMNYNGEFLLQKAHEIGDKKNTVSYIRNYANGAWSEWSEIYTTGNKPYITGSATVAAGDHTCITNHGFTPSAVLWWENSGGREIRSASSFDTTSFNPSVIDTSERVLNYIIFK